MPQIAVIHRDDWEGCAGLWVARLYYDHRGKDYRVKPYPLRPRDAFPLGIPAEYDTVIILNLAFDLPTLLEVEQLTHLIVCGPGPRDKKLAFWHSAEGRSSAHVLWTLLFTGPCPMLIDYLEDVDLDRLLLPDVREINVALRSYNPEPISCQLLDNRLQTAEGREELAAEGRVINRFKRRYIELAVRDAVPTLISGREGLATNRADFIDDIGHKLVRPGGFGLVYYRSRESWKYHLFSSEGSVDVMDIAEPLGGTGSPLRATFSALHPPVPSPDLDHLPRERKETERLKR